MITWQCPGCGSPVRVRRSKQGRAYTLCSGELGPGCQTRCVYGPRPSQPMLAELEREPTPTPPDQDPPTDKPRSSDDGFLAGW